MLKAIKEGRIPFAAHLDACRECRELFAFLEAGAVPGAEPLEHPDESALERFAAVAFAADLPQPSRRRVGTMVFDSWQQAGAVAVRDVGIGDVRRLVLQAGTISLELVADRLADGWEFVARVYNKKQVSSAWLLRAGRKKLLPGVQGFYRWRSKRGPRALRLVTGEQEILFDHISWL